MKFSTLIWLTSLVLASYSGYSQQEDINWLSFDELEDSLAIHPKKVFIYFHADWCAYCKKMDHVAFQDARIIAKLNQDYYAVKMNVETKDTLQFGGAFFYNTEIGKKRNPTHDIPLLLASRKGRPFSLPATIVLDTKFHVLSRYFEYISPKKMLNILFE